MHFFSPIVLICNQLAVTESGGCRFFKRNTAGSMPRRAAALSIWISIAKRGCGVPWPRFGPQGGLFVNARTPSNR
jgi:hypothetical protein